MTLQLLYFLLVCSIYAGCATNQADFTINDCCPNGLDLKGECYEKLVSQVHFCNSAACPFDSILKSALNDAKVLPTLVGFFSFCDTYTTDYCKAITEELLIYCRNSTRIGTCTKLLESRSLNQAFLKRFPTTAKELAEHCTGAECLSLAKELAATCNSATSSGVYPFVSVCSDFFNTSANPSNQIVVGTHILSEAGGYCLSVASTDFEDCEAFLNDLLDICSKNTVFAKSCSTFTGYPGLAPHILDEITGNKVTFVIKLLGTCAKTQSAGIKDLTKPPFADICSPFLTGPHGKDFLDDILGGTVTLELLNSVLAYEVLSGVGPNTLVTNTNGVTLLTGLLDSLGDTIDNNPRTVVNNLLYACSFYNADYPVCGFLNDHGHIIVSKLDSNPTTTAYPCVEYPSCKNFDPEINDRSDCEGDNHCILANSHKCEAVVDCDGFQAGTEDSSDCSSIDGTCIYAHTSYPSDKCSGAPAICDDGSWVAGTNTSQQCEALGSGTDCTYVPGINELDKCNGPPAICDDGSWVAGTNTEQECLDLGSGSDCTYVGSLLNVLDTCKYPPQPGCSTFSAGTDDEAKCLSLGVCDFTQGQDADVKCNLIPDKAEADCVSVNCVYNSSQCWAYLNYNVLEPFAQTNLDYIHNALQLCVKHESIKACAIFSGLLSQETLNTLEKICTENPTIDPTWTAEELSQNFKCRSLQKHLMSFCDGKSSIECRNIHKLIYILEKKIAPLPPSFVVNTFHWFWNIVFE